MKIYLCAMFSRQEEMRELRDRIEALGHKVVSRWLEENFHDPLKSKNCDDCAITDITDIACCDLLIAFTESPEVGYYTGGRHIEVGYALGIRSFTDICIAFVGPRENVFYHLPSLHQFNNKDELLEWLAKPIFAKE